MSSQNRIILIGRLTDTPDSKQTNSGGTLCKFSLAVDRPNTQGMPKVTDFISIVAWDRTADTVQQSGLSKGALALVEGRLTIRKYETDEGAAKWITEVEAREVKSLASGSGSTESDPFADVSNESLEAMAPPADDSSSASFDFGSGMGSPEQEENIEEDVPF